MGLYKQYHYKHSLSHNLRRLRYVIEAQNIEYCLLSGINHNISTFKTVVMKISHRLMAITLPLLAYHIIMDCWGEFLAMLYLFRDRRKLASYLHAEEKLKIAEETEIKIFLLVYTLWHSLQCDTYSWTTTWSRLREFSKREQEWLDNNIQIIFFDAKLNLSTWEAETHYWLQLQN